MTSQFTHLLGQYLQHSHTSVNRLSILSDIPQRTIANWLYEDISKPHQWQSIVKVALALRLNIQQTDELLRSAGHPSLAELRSKVTTQSDKELISKFRSIKPAPFQVISDLPTFVGRTTQVEYLKKNLLNDGRAVILGLRGMGGIGKTTLAAHLAYELREHFPDGVLWARLDVSDTLSILSAFAEAYGKDVNHFKDIESRASVVRSLLSEKRVLIILDNVENSAQVRALIPPSTGKNVVLITTRYDLTIIDGWRSLILEPFDENSGEASALFEKYLGSDFVHKYCTSLLEIATLLGHLPLALGIVAGQLANTFSHSEKGVHSTEDIVSNLLKSLNTFSSRLNTLTRDDIGVRTSFEASYIAMTPYQQTLFSVLGIFDGEDFGSDAVAYLTDQTQDQADVQLRHLLSLSLVQKGRSGRWRLHPLLRDYAREKLNTTDNFVSILEKILLMYRQAAEGRWSFNNPLDTEIPNIRFALDQSYQLNLYQPLVETARVIYPILYTGAWYSLSRKILEQARVAAKELGNIIMEIYFLKGLSLIKMGLGDITGGRENLEFALQLARSTKNNEENVADILSTLGKLEHDTGYRKKANRYFEESLALARKINNLFLIGRNLNNLATGLMAEARYHEAETMFLEALGISRMQNKREEPIHRALINLGELYWQLNDWDRADTHWREAVVLARTGNYRAATVLILSNIARLQAARGIWIDAEKLFGEAIQLAVEIHSPRVESLARSEYGNVLHQKHNYGLAVEQLIRAKELADDAGDMERKGITLYYLGLLYFDMGQMERAQSELDDALDIAKKIQNEVLTADIYFIQAKTLFARKKYTEAKKSSKEALIVYKQLKLSKQKEELENWIQVCLHK